MKKLNKLFLLMIIEVLAILFVYTHVAYGDTASVTASEDGHYNRTGAAYNTIRDSTTAIDLGTITMIVGQRWEDPNYRVNRGFLSVAIPAMSTCSACTLYVDGNTDYSTTDFEIYIHTATYTPPINNYEDYNNFDGWTAGSAHTGTILNDVWNTSSYSANWNTIVLNAAGRAAVLAAQGTTLKLALISKEDYIRSTPTNWEYVAFNTSYTGGAEPYLSIVYIAGFSGKVDGIANVTTIDGIANVVKIDGIE